MNTFRFKIITGFDGACPHSDAGITVKPNGTYEIRPSWRTAPGIGEESIGGGSRFSVKVENLSPEPQRFICHVNWQDEKQIRLRYHDWLALLLPGKTEWETVRTVLTDSGAMLNLMLLPGVSHIAQSPYYGYRDAISFMKSQRGRNGVSFSSIGRSKEGRDIPLLLADIGKSHAKLDVIVMARNHAYESAGSFCVEGMVEYLLAECPPELLNKYRFHFLPMTNPDGVYNGLSRLTSPRGADLNRCAEQGDPAWVALKNYIDLVKPSRLLNLHNWMDKEKDGLLTNTLQDAEEFRLLLPDMREDRHYWALEWTDLFLRQHNLEFCPEEWKSWKDYTLENFGTLAITLEFPWYNRTTARMRQIGKQALDAFLRMQHKENYSDVNKKYNEMSCS